MQDQYAARLRCLLPFLCLLLGASVLTAQEKLRTLSPLELAQQREVPLPFAMLVQPPNLPKLAAKPVSPERAAEIQQLIDSLHRLKSEDVGLLATPIHIDDVFLPVGEFDLAGNRSRLSFKSFAPMRKLVEIGPEALPLLLDALDNDAPTRLVIKAVKSEGYISGGMEFREGLPVNPLNPLEQEAERLYEPALTASTQSDHSLHGVRNEIESYRVKVGDVCFVIIGQIVGRNYECLSYYHPKSDGVWVCTPVHRESLRNQLRHIWKSDNPRQKMLESLLLDYSTRGIMLGDSLDHWGIGSSYQNAAAMRLLYYYPDETAALIAQRVDGFKFTGDLKKDCIANGVRVDDFIDAIGWSKNPQIRSSLTSLRARMTDQYILDALKRAKVNRGKLDE